MKNKILLTATMALIGLLTFSTVAEAHHGRGGRGKHKHVFYERGNRVVVWHNNYNQCRNGRGFSNGCGNNGLYNYGSRMCVHMRNIWRGGQCGARAIVRCNHRGCGMFGTSFRNGRFYNGPRGNGYYRGNRGYGRNGYYNNGRRGGGRYNNQGGRHGNGRYNQGGGRGNGRGNGDGRGNGRGNGRGGR